MEQLTLNLDYFTPICDCEGCFKDSTKAFQLRAEEFYVCDYHNIELMRTDDNIKQNILKNPLEKAFNYRQEILSYNNHN